MKWKKGQIVMVQSRTWANINKPGGCAKIVKVHTNRLSDNLADDEDSYIEGLDVKYTVGGGGENNLDPAIVSPYEELQRGGRSRRGRDFLMQNSNANSTAKPTASRRRGKENVNEATTNKPAAKTKKVKAQDLAHKKQDQTKQNQPHSSQKSGATCSTPLPPPKQATKKQPKKVTPVPKVVLVNRSMKAANDVSPMWMDVTSCSNNHNPNPIRKAQHRLDFDRDIPPLPNALLPPNKSVQSKSKSHKSINETKKRKLPPTAPTHDATWSKNKHGNRPTTSTINFSNSKPKTQPNNSFSRATSKYGSLPQSKSAKKKNLLDVYRSEVEKAHQFMDEMVGPRTTDKAKLSETPQKSRYEEFLSHLHKVWIKTDDEDAISEDDFKMVYQEVSGGLFSNSELDTHLKMLCEDGNEFMLDGGMLYRIMN